MNFRLRAIYFCRIALDTDCAHYDTTSINVFGDYDWQDPPFHITYGHSKDKRPDLKQFLIEMFCVDRDVTIFIQFTKSFMPIEKSCLQYSVSHKYGVLHNKIILGAE